MKAQTRLLLVPLTALGCLLYPLHCPAEPDSTAAFRLRTGTVEIGLSGALSAIDGNTSLTVMLRSAYFIEVIGRLWAFEGATAYTHVASLDRWDLLATFSVQLPVKAISAVGFAGFQAGLRQEWLGSFSQARYPVGVAGGVKFFLTPAAAFRLDYSFRRFLHDPVQDFNEQQILLGISIFVK